MVDTTNFDQIRIGLASPDEIRKWSRGEVKKPETINYRTFKPEPDGLFCEKIFGPTRDWECHCGKYRKIKFRGITCDRCGVEVTRAKVRRERMGHIELAAPVAHIWYLKNVPSPMSLLLDLSPRPLEKVLYFASYIITKVNLEALSEHTDVIHQAVEERKHQLGEQLQDQMALIEDQYREELDATPDMPVADRNKLVATRDERIAYEKKVIDERKAELDSAMRLLLGQNLDMQPGITQKQLLTEPEHRSLGNLADEVDIFICLREGEENEYAENEESRTQSSGIRIMLRKDPKRTLLISQTGADAIKTLLKQIDLEEEGRRLRNIIRETTGPKRVRAVKQLEIVESFRKSKNRPEWMILDSVPVIPPELRPMVQLDGGRFATSDLNDLYRRIINRNNRLKKIKDLRAPESIINHEKRLLQEAVDALIDNGRRSRPVTGSNNRPLKSLSDMLKGKDGRFRKNLLGKRVDYSGRSVIVVGPHLKLNQCGLPKEMALELFKPFVMKRLVQKGLTNNVKTAKKMVERMRPEVWDALEEVIFEHPVMLNRAPTLHRLGIQAFQPVLVDGKAIQLHPLVCPAFNADFDGDQMAVHVPLSTTAQAEARILMMSSENLFSPAHGKPTMTPTRDMVLGSYYITQKAADKTVTGWGKSFPNIEEALLAYHTGLVDLHAEVNVRINGALINTTIGRIIFNQVLPPKLQFLDRIVDSTEMAAIVRNCYEVYGHDRTVKLLDDLKEMGFKYSTTAGITIAMTDMDVPHMDREKIITRTEKAVMETNQRFSNGVISEGERSQTVCELWMRAAEEVGQAMLTGIDPFNPLFMMSKSGARGTTRQLQQLAGMRGLMTDPFGRFIEDLPIKSNFHEGLNVLEYFVSTHGARKGLADTALRTADAGYLTRRMVDVAQDVIVRHDDCGTLAGIDVGAIRDRHEEIESLERRIEGRIAAQDIYDPFTGKMILRRNQEIGHRTLPACPKDAGVLHRAWRCPACDTIITEQDLAAALTQLTRSTRVPGAELEAQTAARHPLEHLISEDFGGETISDQERVDLLDAIERMSTDHLHDHADESIDLDGLLMPAIEEEAPVEIAGPELVTEEDAIALPEAVDELSEEAEDEEEDKDTWALQIEHAIAEEACPHCGTQLFEIAMCEDCGTRYLRSELESPLVHIRRVVAEAEKYYDLARRARQNLPTLDAIVDPSTGKVIVAEGKKATPAQLQQMQDVTKKLRAAGGLATGKVPIRSPLTCELRSGICAACYGRDLATGRPVEVGEATGIIAAQSIGEPGTQLTMRTFHTGGVAGQYLTGVANVKEQRVRTLQQILDDVNRGRVQLGTEVSERERVKQIQKMVKVMEQQVSGLLRVVELFEARKPKGQAIITDIDGTVANIDTRGGGKSVVIHSEQPLQPEENIIGKLLGVEVRDPNTDEVLVEAGKELTPPIVAKLRQAGVGGVTTEERYMVPYRGALRAEVGDVLRSGNPLTEGPLDPQELLRMRGPRDVQEYLVQEIQRVYRSQGVDINDKHVEIIVRQMLRRRKVTEPGDTEFLPGSVADRFEFEDENRRIREAGGQEAQADWVLLGITEASLATDSFLSAASFQKTTRVLTDAAIKGKVDRLIGLKENVIIGRLIPAGTGMDRYRNAKMVSPAGEIRLFEPEITSNEQDFVERLLEESDIDLQRTQAEELMQELGSMKTVDDSEDAELDEDDEFGVGGDELPASQMDYEDSFEDEPHQSDDAAI